jgi:tetratricopeptide (TPR) repeat protein
LLDGSVAALDQVPPDAPPFFSVCTLGWSVDSIDDLLIPVFEETMLVGRRVGSEQGRGYVLATGALAARMAGRPGDASALLQRALRIFEALGDRAGQAHILAQRGQLLRERGDPAAARECFRSAADLRVALPDQRGTTIALTGLALAEAALGNGHRARALGQEACRILDRSADAPGHHGALINLAVVEILGGRPAQATDVLERALAGFPDTQRSFGWQHPARGLARKIRRPGGGHRRADGGARVLPADRRTAGPGRCGRPRPSARCRRGWPRKAGAKPSGIESDRRNQ